MTNKSRENRGIIRRLYLETLGNRDGQGWRCFYCGVPLLPYGENRKPRSPVIDHKDPYSMVDDPHQHDNMVLACYHCNNHKGNLTAELFTPIARQFRVKAMIEELPRAIAAYKETLTRRWNDPDDCQCDELHAVSERLYDLITSLQWTHELYLPLWRTLTQDEKDTLHLASQSHLYCVDMPDRAARIRQQLIVWFGEPDAESLEVRRLWIEYTNAGDLAALRELNKSWR